MFKLVIIATLIIFVASCANQNVHQNLTQQQKAAKIERCKKLQQDIQDLKGKPIRRSSARDYYQKECLQ